MSLKAGDSPKFTARNISGFAPACTDFLPGKGPSLAVLAARDAPLSGGRASAVRSIAAVRQSTTNFLITESPLGNHAAGPFEWPPAHSQNLSSGKTTVVLRTGVM